MNDFRETEYITPHVSILDIELDGIICASGSHDPLREDDSWLELLD